MDSAPDGGYVIRLSATEGRPLSVQFEPAGGERSIAPGDHFDIRVLGPADEWIEVIHGEGFITIWPSPRLKVKVFDSLGGDLNILGY
jgi:hypothetical protein